MVTFKILGPVEVHGPDGPLGLGGPGQLALVAYFVLHADRYVSTDRLLEELWTSESRPTVKALQMAVKRLRETLQPISPDGESVIRTVKGGYVLKVEPERIDATRFEHLATEGQNACRRGHYARALESLLAAQALWRGEPLQDLTYEAFAAAEIGRLQALRRAASIARLEAELQLGRSLDEAVAELRALWKDDETDEKVAELLMLGLYRASRQEDALRVFERVHARKDELGLTPGPTLQDLQRRILDHDSSLRSWHRLPEEFDAAMAVPLIGRESEVAWLQEQWQKAVAAGRWLVAASGPEGIGKTRLAAEIGRIAHENEAAVVYASCAQPDSVAEALARAREPQGKTFVVVDDAEVAGADVLRQLSEIQRTPSPASVLTLVVGEQVALDTTSSLELLPLGRLEVRRIAGSYGPVGGDDSGEWLFVNSEGIPARVHQLAARQKAERRVTVAADEMQDRRAELRSAEKELYQGVTQLQATLAPSAIARGNGAVMCPFKGLAAFDAADADYFFGRESLVAELVTALPGRRLLGLVGPSGSGKSSVLRAGLLPALARGVLAGSDRWTQTIIRPGEHPPVDFAPDASDGPYVVAVDQFEETFTTCSDEEERKTFIARLVSIARDPSGHGLVLLALRDDHYGRCARYPTLSRLLTPGHILVPAMQGHELRRAIKEPTRRARLRVEPELVDALVTDIQGQAGGLPLLSTALLELWQHRSDDLLTYQAYQRIGGVRGAVARLAEDAIDALEPEQEQVAHDILMCLVHETGDGDVERRRASPEDLHVHDREEVAAVVEILTERRLLTSADGKFELAHEALLREWPRLSGWIDDDRERMHVQRKLHEATDEWELSGRDEEHLYGPVRLASAQSYAREGRLDLSDSERAFLAASRRKVRRRRTVAFGLLSLALVVITVIAIVAVEQRRDADHQRDIAVSRELAAESGSLLDSDPELGLRLALWALDTAETAQAEFAVRQAVLAYHQQEELPVDPTDANAAAFSADGSRVVAGGAEGEAQLWELGGERRVKQLASEHGALLAARYSAQGDRIALGYEDGTVLLTDAALGDATTLLSKTEESAVTDLAFSGDGARVVAAFDDGSIRVMSTRGDPAEIRLRGHEDEVRGVALTPDGQQVFTAGADGKVLLWDVADGAAPRELYSGPAQNAVAVSPDGRLVVAVGEHREVKVWNARSRTRVRTFDGMSDQGLAVAFSRDSRRFATGGRDGVIRVWSAAGGPLLSELRGQGGRIYDVGFGPGNDRLVSAGDDGTVKTWDSGTALGWFVPGDAGPADFAQDGSAIATVGGDGTARIFDARDGSLLRTLRGPEGYTDGSFSASGDQIVIGYDLAARIHVWPWRRGERRTVQLPEGKGMNAVRFEAAGERIVYADAEGKLAVRDLATGDEVELLGGPADVWAVAFSPDGTRVAAVGEQTGVMVWRVDSPDRPERTYKGYRGHLNALAYLPDGRIVTAGSDQTVRIWGPRGSVVLRGHTNEVTTVVVSPDGKRIFSTAQDGTLRLWDAQRGLALAVLQSSEEPLGYIAGSRDGRLMTLDGNGNVKVFDCGVCGSLEEVRSAAEALAPRPLTPEERGRFLAAAA
jgi:WD40 repeat protein/DNA-binding SARP family transcriptional activator